MSSSPHPLAVLVGPLTFATAKGFARLSQVKGLRALLEGALHRPGVSAETQAALSAQLD